MLSLLKKMGGVVLDQSCSFPCLSCMERLPPKRNCLCSVCSGKLSTIDAPFCSGCGGELSGILELCEKCIQADTRPWSKAVALFDMRGVGKSLIHRFKYYGTPEIARSLGTLAGAKLMASGINVDYLVPTPLHWTRSFMRGFNQAELICRIISEERGIPVRKLLKRTKRTKQQARLNKKQRKNNLKGAFSVKKDEISRNSSILLVDDVMTTGSTLTAAAKVLQSAGFGDINVLVLARR